MRIARDLHDSAGHAINVILVHAGAGRLQAERDPAAARAALGTIEDVARETVAEIDRLVGVLRDDATPQRDHDEVEPPPGVAALERLVERHRAAGMDVTTHHPGRAPSRFPRASTRAPTASSRRLLPTPRVTATAAHRSRSCSAAARSTSRSTNPVPREPAAWDVDGHGIIGMRERAALLGGSFEAGARNGRFPGTRTTPRGGPPEHDGGRRGVRVLIVDDDDLMRAGLRGMLSNDEAIEVVGEAGDGREVVYRTRLLRPDVVLMDVRMPDVDGISATRELLAAFPEVKVVILTTFEQDDYIFGALSAGASGFLLKRTRPEELVAAIHTIAAGDSLLSPSVTSRVIERMAQQPPPDASRDARLDELTPRECEVLALVARGLSNGEIAATLVIEESTVKTHVKRILAKLGVRDRVQAVIFAYESGLTPPGSGTHA